MIIKVEDRPMNFSDLKAGDIFSFTSAPGCTYIKTTKSYSIEGECIDCGEEFSFDLKDYCVNLATGEFYESNSWEKVILYKTAELTVSR